MPFGFFRPWRGVSRDHARRRRLNEGMLEVLLATVMLALVGKILFLALVGVIAIIAVIVWAVSKIF